MDVESLLAAAAARVDARLSEILPSPACPPASLHEAMRYSCLAPGKRLRPALCLASCEALGGDPDSALDPACAIEMVHAFSLIHDDLPAIDDDDLRRGRPTCHRQFGEAIAILAGDALFALAFETLGKAQLPPEAIVEALRALSSATGSEGLVGGEVIDVESEGRPVSEETLVMIHARKTGALIAASTEIGALCAGAPVADRVRLREFGEKIGLAFQIADDVLNETATADALGKAVGSDRARGKATYPGVYGLDAARKQAKDLVAEAESLVENKTLRAFAQFAIERMR